MIELTRAVHSNLKHKDNVGGMRIMKKQPEYAETYHIGNTVIHVVEPDISDEENERRVKAMYSVGWKIIEDLAAKGEKV
jgi:hypothetical protein